MDNEKENVVQTAASLARKVSDPVTAPDGEVFAFVPVEGGGFIMRSLGYPTDGPTLPKTPKQLVSLNDRESFVDYIGRFINDDDRTVLFANRASATLTAIFDYHKEASSSGLDAATGRLAHQARWTVERSLQIARWEEFSLKTKGKRATQEEIAAFIENNVQDVVSFPVASTDGAGTGISGAQVLEAVMNIDSKSEMVFKRAVRMDNNTVNVTMVSTNGGESNLSLPHTFWLGIPLFIGEPADRVKVKLNHKIADGKISFELNLPNLDLVRRNAFDEIVKAAGIASALAPLFADF